MYVTIDDTLYSRQSLTRNVCLGHGFFVDFPLLRTR